MFIVMMTKFRGPENQKVAMIIIYVSKKVRMMSTTLWDTAGWMADGLLNQRPHILHYLHCRNKPHITERNGRSKRSNSFLETVSWIVTMVVNH